MGLIKPEVKLNAQKVCAQHIIADCFEVSDLSPKLIEPLMTRMAIAGGATILDSNTRTFENGGFTSILLLAESHISVHTWPEHNYAAFDVFMCGHSSAKSAIEILKKELPMERIQIQPLLRGC